MKLNYVSNFHLNDSSGGWNGINYKMVDELNKLFELTYIGGISPKANPLSKVVSKCFRIVGLSGKYFFFSKNRLNQIKKQVLPKLDNSYTFFFGATPWIHLEPKGDYAVYLDICFKDYIKIFLNGEKFLDSDITRISEKEKTFLLKANKIFWGSNWAQTTAEKLYKCKFNNSVILSTGGHLPIPDNFVKTKISSPLKLLFISTNFTKKGGHLAFAAAKKLFNLGIDIEFNILGDKPEGVLLNDSISKYHGYLSKEKPEELDKIIELIKESHFLVHPTSMDTMGAVIVETGYYGVPSIAPNNFGIPDLIEDEKTGILISLPIEIDQIVSKINYFISNPNEYDFLSKRVFDFFTNERSWNSLAAKIKESLTK